MEDPRWLRLITIGLILAALAVGYFLLTGKLSPTSTTKKPSPSASVLGQNVQTSPTPAPSGVSTPTPTPASAYTRIVNRTQAEVQTLPKTGFPIELAIVFSISTMLTGWGLRKFPH